MSESEELNASELGTLDYWEKIYDREIENFKDHGDVGEVWFGEQNARKVVRYISKELDLSPTDKIVDIGCGNGWTLIELSKNGFTQLTGIDYSEKAVDLASKILQDSSEVPSSTINLMVCDILDIESSSLANDFKLIHDKGTYDAISLNPDDPQGQRTKYIKNVCNILRPDGYLVISSCNWTKDELITHFQGDFDVVCSLHTPAFSFGGKVGESLACVVFRKKK
ncbi:EEF1A lysine methyltransferase 2 [Venturia canescens]|uniref:EEF1A lysine methyltransferase 2 n=1 Tax=Venturia canescens TaxID=32260 RepID=UPI001C9C4931|nr:EEF1A lysine methyltransferase 2 [Venturia canescens]